MSVDGRDYPQPGFREKEWLLNQVFKISSMLYPGGRPVRLRYKRNGWGGARPGAGRPRKPEPDVEALPPDPPERERDRDEALAAAAAAIEAEDDAWRLATVIERNIRSASDPFFLRRSREYAEELLERARPRQRPMTCWQCWEATALATGYKCARCEGATP